MGLVYTASEEISPFSGHKGSTMLVASLDGNPVEADVAIKGHEYMCPRCKETVILKQGRIVIPHFAHKAKDLCRYAVGETMAHYKAKLFFRDSFRMRGWTATIETEVDCLPGDRRADVLVTMPNQRKFAIELQHTKISDKEIEDRTFSYHRANLGVIWVSFLKKSTTSDAKESRRHDALFVEQYTAPPWERWAHGYHFGKLWFYNPDDNTLWHGRLEPHDIYREERTWYDEYGNENSAGGYWKSTKWKELTLRGPYNIDSMGVKSSLRKAGAFGKNYYPGGTMCCFSV